jgi:UDP-glucose 4-epimerase
VDAAAAPGLDVHPSQTSPLNERYGSGNGSVGNPSYDSGLAESQCSIGHERQINLVKPRMHDFAKAFERRTVAITGGLGFIGSTLARRLVDLHARVRIVDKLLPEHGGNPFNICGLEDRVDVVEADVRDFVAMKELVAGCDVVFHLAGQSSHLDSMRDPLTDLEINACGSLAVLEACRAVNPAARVVYASTRQVYGIPEHLPVDEGHPLRPVDANGISKIAAESYHTLYALHGIRSCSLRLTNTYGPRMRIKDARQTFVGLWVRQLIEGEPILVFGDGSQLRDFNYVEDVVDALLLAAIRDEASGRIFNLGGPRISLKDLAMEMIRLHGSGTTRLEPFPPELKRIDIGSYYADFSLIQRELGWQPSMSLSDGLTETLGYYREHWRRYV